MLPLCETSGSCLTNGSSLQQFLYICYLACSVHVETATGFAGEAIVSVLVVRLVRADGHRLLGHGKTGNVGVFGRLLDHLGALLFVIFARAERRVHLPGHEHGKRGEATLVWHGQFRLTHSLLRVVLVHRVDRSSHGSHLLTDLCPSHLTVTIAYTRFRHTLC